MFQTLEEIKTQCDKTYGTNPLIMIDESTVAHAQKPPKNSFHFKLTILPPLDGLLQAQELRKLKEQLEKDGFKPSLRSGKSTGGGYHIELTVEDKRQQLYSLGQPVGFRLNPMGQATKFRVVSCSWDLKMQQFIYQIESDDKQLGAKTVSESDLIKI